MKEITDISALDFNKIYTFSDYFTWKFKERVELIKGRIFKMSPAPSTYHQQISISISARLYQFLKNSKCRVFTAPFDVRLKKPNEKETYTVVQPDIAVICDSSKLDEKGCIGAPDLIVEILSPHSSKKDLNEKYELYEESGVIEYWVIHPAEETLLIYSLNSDGKYIPSRLFHNESVVKSNVITGFELNMKDVFAK